MDWQFIMSEVKTFRSVIVAAIAALCLGCGVRTEAEVPKQGPSGSYGLDASRSRLTSPPLPAFGVKIYTNQVLTFTRDKVACPAIYLSGTWDLMGHTLRLHLKSPNHFVDLQAAGRFEKVPSITELEMTYDNSKDEITWMVDTPIPLRKKLGSRMPFIYTNVRKV